VAPSLATTWLTPDSDGPLLVVGPSLGTSVVQLWGPCATELAPAFSVLAWDLPGHAGTEVGDPFSLAELAASVVAAVDAAVGDRGAADRRFGYAGDSVGGAVGLQLLLDEPERVSAAVLLSTGARIGERSGWQTRAATVRAEGTAAVVEGSLARWFSTRVTERRPGLLAHFAATLRDVDREGYAQVCDALADFDVRSRLAEIGAPVLAVAGAEDVPTPVENLTAIADGVREGRLVVLDHVAHLPPAEAPTTVAGLVREHLPTVDR